MRFYAVLLALVCASCGAAGVPYAPAAQGVPAFEEPAPGAAMDNPPMAGPGTCVKPDDPGCPTSLVVASRSQDCVTKTLEGLPQEIHVEFVSAAPVAPPDFEGAVTLSFPSEDSPLYRDIPADVVLMPADADPASEGHQVKPDADGNVRFFLSLTHIRGAFDYFVTARGGTLRDALGRDAVSEDPSCKPSFEGASPKKLIKVPPPPTVNFDRQFLIQ